MFTARRRSCRKTRAFSTGAALALVASLVLTPLAAHAQEFDVSVNSVAELSGLTAIAAGNGDGVNVRAQPSLGAEIVTTVSDGTVVALRIDVADTVRADGIRWWPVVVDGRNGWIAGPYLTDSGGQSASDSPPSTGSDFAAGSYVRVVTDDNTGVNVRSAPRLSGDLLTGVPDGGIVQVVDGPYTDSSGGAWYKVTDGETTGYSSAEWLALATGPEAPGAAQAEFDVDSWVRVSTDDRMGLNLRTSASRDAGLVRTLRENARLLVLDGPVLDGDGSPWYLVEHFSRQGYVIGTFLEQSSRPDYAGQYRSIAATSTSSSVSPAGVATGSFRLPLDTYVVTQEFGCSYLGFYSYNAAWGCPVHDGLDLAAPMNTPLKAADGGTVTAAGWCDCGLGYYVQIDHGNGFQTIYGHMVGQPPVSAGQSVSRGEVIGYIGSTGTSTGPHVHFMVLLNGSAVNPRDYAG